MLVSWDACNRCGSFDSKGFMFSVFCSHFTRDGHCIQHRDRHGGDWSSWVSCFNVHKSFPMDLLFTLQQNHTLILSIFLFVPCTDDD